MCCLRLICGGLLWKLCYFVFWLFVYCCCLICLTLICFDCLFELTWISGSWWLAFCDFVLCFWLVRSVFFGCLFVLIEWLRVGFVIVLSLLRILLYWLLLFIFCWWCLLHYCFAIWFVTFILLMFVCALCLWLWFDTCLIIYAWFAGLVWLLFNSVDFVLFCLWFVWLFV